jgi:ATP-dependent protease ClpP protease subunit
MYKIDTPRFQLNSRKRLNQEQEEEVIYLDPEKAQQLLQAMKNNDNQNNIPSSIEVVANKIYYYAEIERHHALLLNRTIDELNNSILWTAASQHNNPADLFLFIHSYGGDVFTGLSVMDSIINSPVPVTTIVDGAAASAATLISVVGHKRYIKRHSFMLIHQLSSLMWGKYESLQDSMDHLDNLMNIIKKIYKEHTKMPMKELETILKKDLWLDAETCLKYGLVDGYYEDLKCDDKTSCDKILTPKKKKMEKKIGKQ